MSQSSDVHVVRNRCGRDPMAAHIQWDVFRKGDTYLVRMLYNEKETAFKAGCAPVAKGSAFYDLDELERCFGRTKS
ncbi:hypothetical protein OK006_9806 [Actinobacteria bacterium OK006]|nr:hypothetical protein OK006_9806 [Actinobacteria bacterium OK006]